MSKLIRVSDDIHKKLKHEAIEKGQTLLNVTSGLLSKGLNAKRKSRFNGSENPIKSGAGWVTGVNGERVDIAPLRKADINGYFISDSNTLVYNNITNYLTYNFSTQTWDNGFKEGANYNV